jgi:hypothetical protein
MHYLARCQFHPDRVPTHKILFVYVLLCILSVLSSGGSDFYVLCTIRRNYLKINLQNHKPKLTNRHTVTQALIADGLTQFSKIVTIENQW